MNKNSYIKNKLNITSYDVKDYLIEPICNLIDNNIIDYGLIDDSEYLFYIGLYYNNIKAEFEESKKYYKLAIEKGNNKAMNNMAIIFYNAGEYDEAEKYYKMAEQYGNFVVLKNLGLLYLKQKKYNNAIEYFKKSIENKQINHVESMYRLGKLYVKLKKYTDAEKYLRMASENGHQEATNFVNKYSKYIDYV